MTDANQSSAATHWARLGERGVYLGMRIMFATYRVLGRGGFWLLLYPVMGYFFVFGKQARLASRTFLARVYADPRGREVLGTPPDWRQSFRHFIKFGDGLLDKLAAWSEEISENDVVFHNRAIFDEVLESGRGALLIGSHLGNMEVCRALGELSLGLKLNVLVHTKHAPNFNRLLNRVGPASNISLFQTTEIDPATAMLLYERIAQGEIVVIVGDRTPVSQSGRHSWAPFLGHPAPFPHGPYILAAILKCPVQLIFCLKRDDRYHVIFEPFSDSIAIPRKSRADVLDACAKRYAARLEQFCVTDPYSWFNFFDFWRQAESAPPEHVSVPSSPECR